jgi:FixJ family two-component response regulator
VKMTESRPAQSIFIVDDDAAVRQTLSLVLSNAGYAVVCFADGGALLAEIKACSPICIILDVHIPGKSGLDILRNLSNQYSSIPVFIMSGKGDIAMAVDAIKNGALDFIEKPFRGSDVIERVRRAVDANMSRQSLASDETKAPSFNFPGRQTLSMREQEVLACVVSGLSNKEMARQLGISPRTIEVHRARIIEKAGAKNTADLIRLAMS